MNAWRRVFRASVCADTIAGGESMINVQVVMGCRLDLNDPSIVDCHIVYDYEPVVRAGSKLPGGGVYS